ncbi:MAG: hypothetical protein V3V41_09815, partial [Candidatus Heimdallarchaeota archaeon]
TNFTHEHRLTYQQLIDAINRLGYSDDQVVLSINTPGLEYFTSQPVIDLFMIGLLTKSGLSNTTFPLKIQNVTRTLEFFNEIGVSIFVALNNSNVWYPAYLERIYWDYFIYRFMHNNIYFTYRYTNEEYILFTINSYDPFIGPVDIQLASETKRQSLLALSPDSLLIYDDIATLDAIFDLTMVPTVKPVNISVTLQYTTSSNDTILEQTDMHQLEKPSTEIFSRISLLSLPKESIYFATIGMTIYYEDYEGYIEELIYNLDPFYGNSVNITRHLYSWFYSGYYGFNYH